MNLLEEIRAFRELVLRKQDRLTPGDYIIIENDVISADLSRVDDVEHDIRDLKAGYAAVIAKNLQQDNTLADHETRLIDAEGDIDDLESCLSDLEEKVDNIHGFDIVPLGEGDYDPETGIPTIENPKNNTLYLVPNLAEEDQKNLWIEWLWIQSKWEQFGAASIDMNNYVKKTDYATTSKTGVVKIKPLGGLTVASNGDLSVSPATVGDISTYTSNPLPITPSTVPDAVYYGLGRISRSGYLYSEQEKINIRQMLGATGVVADVRLDGASVLDSYGVARIPLATAGQKGVVRARSAESSPYNYGVDIPATGTPEIVPAIHSQIKGAPPDYVIKSPIVPGTQHESVFYGLAKAAGDTTQQSAPDSEFPVGTYTPPAITAIQRMIGIEPATDETAGLVKASNIGGIDVDSSGSLGLYPATQANITGRTFGQRPITPENFDFAVKAALTDGLGAEWTAAEKAAARERIGAGQGGGGVTDVTVDDVSVVDPNTGVAAIDTSDFGKVKDVTINGTTIVDDTTGIASIPIGNTTTYGVYKVNETNGIGRTNTGILMIARATDTVITGRSSYYNPIVPKNFDYAVKAALTDGVGPAYTTTEQAAARTRLGVDYPVKDVVITGSPDTSIINSDGTISLHNASFTYSAAGVVYIKDPSATSIRLGTATYTPLTIKTANQAVFYGLAKAAGDTTMASSSNPVGTYTDEAKTAIKSMLGITPGEEGGVSVTLDDDGDIKIHGLGGQGGGGAVNDVTVNGTSIVDSETGVAEIPANTNGTPSLWYIDINNGSGGLQVHPVRNKLEVSTAGGTALLNRYSMKFVEASVIDYATKTAMSAPIAATAGMKDGEYHYPAWTQQEQVRARERLGIGDWELIIDHTLESDSNYVFERDDDTGVILADYDKFYIVINGKERPTPVGTIYVAFKTNNIQMDSVKRYYVGKSSPAGDRSITRMYADFTNVDKNNMDNMSYAKVIGYMQDGCGTSMVPLAENGSQYIGQSNPFNLYIHGAGTGTNIKVYATKSFQPSGFKYTDAYINSLIDQKLSGLSVEGVGF